MRYSSAPSSSISAARTASSNLPDAPVQIDDQDVVGVPVEEDPIALGVALVDELKSA